MNNSIEPIELSSTRKMGIILAFFLVLFTSLAAPKLPKKFIKFFVFFAGK